MNHRVITICLFTFFAGTLSTVHAQRTPKKNPTTGSQNPKEEKPDTKKTITNFDNKIPIRYDTATTDDTPHKSLRKDGATDKGAANVRMPLPYEHLRWDDALYAEKIWREIDLREKINQTFRYQGADDNGSQMFINILLKAVNDGQVQAFNAVDDRFTSTMTPTEITGLTRGSLDTTAITDVEHPEIIKEYLVTRSAFDPKTVTKLRIKEEWVFDREASRMFCRIIGIAPIMTKYNKDGSERGSIPLFWVYYPDLRPLLANSEVYNPKNQGNGSMTWEELFEARMFSSYVVKSTLDNPGNKMLKQMYPKDQVAALLEGEKIKERIFNYEQDLWSY